MRTQLLYGLLPLLLAATSLAQGSDRRICPDNMCIRYIDGSSEARIDYCIQYATQDAGPLDLSFDALVFADGQLIDIHPFSIIIGGGGGGQTCGGSCPTGDCSQFGPDSSCSDFGQFAGSSGCACDVVI